MITFEQLQALQLIAKTGSFSRAAEQLYLTQPAISQRIKHLEQILGTALFDRNRRGGGIRLTQAGEATLRFANHVLEEFERLLSEIDQLEEASRRRALRIAAGPNATRHVLPDVLARFQDRYPCVRVNVVQSIATSEMISQLVQNGTAELGIASSPIRDARLASVPFITYRLTLVAPPSHPLLSITDPQPSDVLRYPFALFPSYASTIRREIERQAQLLGMQIDVVLEALDWDVLKGAAMKWSYLTIVPEQFIQDELRSGRLVAVRALNLPRDIEICLIYDATRPLSMDARRFIDVARWHDQTQPDVSPSIVLSAR